MAIKEPFHTEFENARGSGQMVKDTSVRNDMYLEDSLNGDETLYEVYQALNIMKVVFILFVIARHMHWYFDVPRVELVYIALLSLVEIFMGFIFFMSGMGLTLSSLNNPVNLKTFYRRRFLRIYPLYLVSLSLYIFFVAKIDIYNFIAHVVSLHNLFPKYCHNPKPLWFMGIIFQSYLLFPALLKLYLRHESRMLIGISGFYVVYAACLLWYEYHSDKLMYVSSNLQDVTFGFFVLQYVVGMYVAKILFKKDLNGFNRVLRIGHVTFLCLIPLTACLVLTFSEKSLYYIFKFISPVYSFATAAVCLSLATTCLNKALLRFFSRISRGVFSIYLFHEFMLASLASQSKSVMFGVFVGVPATILGGFGIQWLYDLAMEKAQSYGEVRKVKGVDGPPTLMKS